MSPSIKVAEPSSVVKLILTFCLIALFGFAALDKLVHYDRFVLAINSYILVPAHWGNYFAMGVILSEIWIAIGLSYAPWRRAAAFSASGLLILFSVALSVNIYFGVTGGCGCWFTVTLGQPKPLHVVFDLVLALLTFTLWLEPSETVHAINSV